jgi:membrane-bound PQQ-dependent dehydrogenase (glucose/quinate/shikimate family)
LLAIAGIAMAVPGAWLVVNAGSPYYLIAGAMLMMCSRRAFQNRESALIIYGALLIGTTVWGIWEIGLDFWGLMPRTVFLSVIGFLLLIAASPTSRNGRAFLLGSLLIAVLATTLPLQTRETLRGAGVPPSNAVVAGDEDWSSYGNRHSDRYSPLAEITPANVGDLQQAWTYHTGLYGPDGKRRASLELTPLMVDGLLYGCTAFDSVFALDPVTGQEIWRRDILERAVLGGHPVCRGLSFYRAPAGPLDCPARLLIATVDNHLVALDSRSGKPCAGFGQNGKVDLTLGLGTFPQGWTHPTSPPTIVNGTAVVGAFVIDNQSTNVPPGVIRGYDAASGALKWAFDPARPEDPTPLPPGAVYTPSTPNAWTVFSADDRLNLVYVPMGNGSPDFYGANRSPTTDHFSTSLVALDASTGRVRWTFQAVHHDLWDYDLAAQPALVDFPAGDSTVPALVLATKTGQLFVLDRRTGLPLTPVAERTAPKSPLPGERSSPTQPYSVGMPDLSGKRLTEADMWGLTPFDQLYCRIAFKRSVYEGMYTPLGLTPSLRYPGELGGIDWGSVSIDEGRGLLIVNANYMADRDQFISREQANREGLVPRTDPRGHFAPGGAMAGTPYAVHWGAFLTALGVPCQRPPYGTLSAIDLRSRQTVWSRPLGDARNSGPFKLPLGLPIELGAPNIGGTLTTGGGIVYVAATQDEMFRAIDVHSGRVLWQSRLPAGGHATPITYRGSDGHQYVVVAAGGGALQDKPGDTLVAFRLNDTVRGPSR